MSQGPHIPRTLQLIRGSPNERRRYNCAKCANCANCADGQYGHEQIGLDICGNCGQGLLLHSVGSVLRPFFPQKHKSLLVLAQNLGEGRF